MVSATTAVKPTRSARRRKPPYFVGVDVGGTNIKAGVVDSSGRRLSRASIKTRAAEGPGPIADRIAACVSDSIRRAKLRPERIAGVGLTSPGPLDSQAGVIITAPNLPGFENVPLRQMVGDRIGLPVVLVNDANAAAWGEFWCGAGRHVDSLVMFTLGTGIGGGIVTDGRLLIGAHDHAAEVGHQRVADGGRLCGCGQRGCLEAYASATGVVGCVVEALEAGRRSSLRRLWRNDPDALTARVVFEAADAGDALAKRIVHEAAEYLAIGVVNVMNILNPAMVVFAGGMIAAGDGFLDRIRDGVKRRAFPRPGARTRIVYSRLVESAGVIGAAGCARTVYLAGQP